MGQNEICLLCGWSATAVSVYLVNNCECSTSYSCEWTECFCSSRSYVALLLITSQHLCLLVNINCTIMHTIYVFISSKVRRFIQLKLNTLCISIHQIIIIQERQNHPTIVFWTMTWLNFNCPHAQSSTSLPRKKKKGIFWVLHKPGGVLSHLAC